MNRWHPWKLCFSSPLEISKTSCHILLEKLSLPNRTSTCLEVNNKIHTVCSELYRKFFPNSDSPGHLPQHKQIPIESLVKFQLDPTVGFRVMLNIIKLDGRKVYAKIRIWPFSGRITRLNRITQAPLGSFFLRMF
jgi:hypothetical protein